MTMEWAARECLPGSTVRLDDRPLAPMTPIRTLAALVFAAVVVAAPQAAAQTGQQLYTTYCAGCHGPAGNNKNGVLGGKDWNIIKLAMDTKPDMTAELRPLYNAQIITDNTFMTIAGYLATFGGGVTSQLSMPSAFAFGTQTVNVGSSVQTKNVSSIGNAAVQISTVTSSNPAEFPIVSRTCTDGGFVNPLSSCSISVQFTPLVAGARSGTITVASNGLGSPQTIAMSGTGSTGGPPPSAGSLSVPTSLVFGSSPVGVQTSGSVLNVTNTGGTAVTVNGIATSPAAEFPITGLTCASVAPGASCTITVAFRPQAAGARSGTLTVTDTGTGSPHTVSLSGTGSGGGGQGATKIPVVEYFNASFGHYFMTADSDEIGGLDAGAYNYAFVRTQLGFNAWNAQAAGTVPVCRFFTTPGTFGTKSSHFYTANAAECEGLKLNPNWTYEKIAFFIAVPTAGACPGGTVPIYRMYNHGQTGAPNHRFTTDFTLYNTFINTQGWDAEGIGFCAPP